MLRNSSDISSLSSVAVRWHWQLQIKLQGWKGMFTIVGYVDWVDWRWLNQIPGSSRRWHWLPGLRWRVPLEYTSGRVVCALDILQGHDRGRMEGTGNESKVLTWADTYPDRNPLRNMPLFMMKTLISLPGWYNSFMQTVTVTLSESPLLWEPHTRVIDLLADMPATQRLLHSMHWCDHFTKILVIACLREKKQSVPISKSTNRCIP